MHLSLAWGTTDCSVNGTQSSLYKTQRTSPTTHCIATKIQHGISLYNVQSKCKDCCPDEENARTAHVIQTSQGICHKNNERKQTNLPTATNLPSKLSNASSIGRSRLGLANITLNLAICGIGKLRERDAHGVRPITHGIMDFVFFVKNG